jgi:glycosyltransferase involved in cell wall biosynthesis
VTESPYPADRAAVPPLVTVSTPTCNRARFLPAAVQNGLAQSHRALELIVIDDSSTDETLDVLAAVDGVTGRRVHLEAV